MRSASIILKILSFISLFFSILFGFVDLFLHFCNHNITNIIKMTYQEALKKKVQSDWVTVSRILGISSNNVINSAKRPNSDRYKEIMDTLVQVVESRERLINKYQRKHV